MPNWNPGQNRSEDECFTQPSRTLNNHVLSTCLISFCLLCTVVCVFAFCLNGKQVFSWRLRRLKRATPLKECFIIVSTGVTRPEVKGGGSDARSCKSGCKRQQEESVGGGLIYLLDSRYTTATAALNPGPRNAGVMMNCQY